MKSMRTLLKWNLWVCLLIVTAFTSCKDDNDDGNTEKCKKHWAVTGGGI